MRAPEEGAAFYPARRCRSAKLAAMAKLYFYYSAMNAGKTTTLLQSAHNYRERGMRVAILTPRLDHRGGSGTVASRIGLRADGTAFGRDDDLERMVRASVDNHGPLHCVLVDEAQFLGKSQVWQLSEIVDRLRIPVLAYGLRTDFMGELFEGSQYLLAWADELSEIKTICHTGKKATMVVRVDDHGRAITQGPQVEIGGNERYVSVSRAEFKNIVGGEGRIELQQSRLPLEPPHDDGTAAREDCPNQCYRDRPMDGPALTQRLCWGSVSRVRTCAGLGVRNLHMDVQYFAISGSAGNSRSGAAPTPQRGYACRRSCTAALRGRTR